MLHRTILRNDRSANQDHAGSSLHRQPGTRRRLQGQSLLHPKLAHRALMRLCIIKYLSDWTQLPPVCSGFSWRGRRADCGTAANVERLRRRWQCCGR